MTRLDPREQLRIMDADPEEREEMRRRDFEEAEAAMRRLSAELDALNPRSPEAQKVQTALAGATDRHARSRNMNAWLHWKGVSR